MSDCIFCKIIKKEMPAELVYEDDILVAFNDINPKANTHILIVPKKHIESVKDLSDDDRDVVVNIILRARDIAQEAGLSGYKFVFNVGRDGGQVIDHLHMHLLSGNGMQRFN